MAIWCERYAAVDQRMGTMFCLNEDLGNFVLYECQKVLGQDQEYMERKEEQGRKR